jgi:hypothetical protein
MNKIKIQDKAKQLRTFRKIHRFSASFLLVFFFFIAISGTLLGWKKHSNGFLLKDTQIGTTTDLKQWISLDSLRTIAVHTHQNITLEEGIINRMEIRPEKGIIKFTFKNSFIGLQIDGATGAVLSEETRRSDFIEQIHDGSIVDRALGWTSGSFKVFYTTIMGLGLLVFTITGYLLWAGPRKIKRKIGN